MLEIGKYSEREKEFAVTRARIIGLRNAAKELGIPQKNIIDFARCIGIDVTEFSDVKKKVNSSTNYNQLGGKKDMSVKFTALGMPGSGKTCYIIGMHYVMASGERGWTLIPDGNATRDKLNRLGRKIDDSELGYDRFPAGTNQEDPCDNYCFSLHYLNQPVMSFDWIDYAGALFEEVASVAFNEIQQSILESTSLYIFLDGQDLCHEDERRKIRNIRNKCSTYIQPHITDFVTKHNYVPPIVFVVTKYDLCKPYFQDDNELSRVVQEAFSSLFFDPNVEMYITCVSLGEDISENEYRGEVDPVNVQLPFFIGIHHQLIEEYNEMSRSDEQATLYRKMVSNMVDVLNEKQKSFQIIKGSRTGGVVKPFVPDEWRIY